MQEDSEATCAKRTPKLWSPNLATVHLPGLHRSSFPSSFPSSPNASHLPRTSQSRPHHQEGSLPTHHQPLQSPWPCLVRSTFGARRFLALTRFPRLQLPRVVLLSSQLLVMGGFYLPTPLQSLSAHSSSSTQYSMVSSFAEPLLPRASALPPQPFAISFINLHRHEQSALLTVTIRSDLGLTENEVRVESSKRRCNAELTQAVCRSSTPTLSRA